ncbi:microtubule-associated protein 9 [Discoglossus pictus]
MAEEDNDFSNFLAYTKSPKTSKRTSFQDELQRAINARVSRQQAIEETEESQYSEYSEEFESDSDSLNESFNKKNTVNSKINKSVHDFHFSDEENDLQKKKFSFLKDKGQFGSKNKKELEDAGIRKESNSGNGYRKSPVFNKGNGHPKSPVFDNRNSIQKSPVYDEGKMDLSIENSTSKPIPKPRENLIKPSPKTSVSISASNESFKPTPQQRSMLKKSNHPDEHDSPQTEDKYFSNKPVSLSAPSSLTKLNQQISSSGLPVLSEDVNSEGSWLSNPPSPLLRSKTFPPSVGKDNVVNTREASYPLLKDLTINETKGFEKSDSQDSGRRSPSVLEMMLSTVNERSNQQDRKDHQRYNDIRSVSEKIADENNSKMDRLPSSRSLKDMQTTKKSSKSRTHIAAKSRYLGTLTVLDKSLKEISSDTEAADAVRATVYQNWVAKKKVFLNELQKIKKLEEEQVKEKEYKDLNNKKEEAKAAFYAWKAEKRKDIKEKTMKQKELEDKKMREIQEMAQKKEESRKAFEKWKEHKEGYLKEKTLKEKQTEIEKKRQEERKVLEKKKENISAIKSWNEHKEHVVKEKKKEKVHEKVKHEKIKAEKEDKEKKALDVYDKWLEKKERRERIEKKQKKLQAILDDDPPPPWSPPGKTIPAGR